MQSPRSSGVTMFPDREQIAALLGSTVYVTARPDVDVAESGNGGSFLSKFPGVRERDRLRALGDRERLLHLRRGKVGAAAALIRVDGARPGARHHDGRGARERAGARDREADREARARRCGDVVVRPEVDRAPRRARGERDRLWRRRRDDGERLLHLRGGLVARVTGLVRADDARPRCRERHRRAGDGADRRAAGGEHDGKA